MKVAIFSDTFYPKTDGMSTSSQNLAASLARQGHQVLVVAPKPSLRRKEAFSLPGVEIVWLASVPAGWYPDLRIAVWSPELRKKLQTWQPDVVHAMSPMPISLAGIAYAKMKKLPLVMTFHTYFMDPEYLKVVKVDKTGHFVEELGWDLARVVHARAEVTIAPSDYVKRDLEKWQFKEPIVVIPSGVQTNSPVIDRQKLVSLRQQWNVPDKNVLVTIGRVSVEKNLRGLLRVVQLVKKQIPTVRLLVVGDGPDLSAIKKQVKKLQLEQQVSFTGSIPHQKLLTDGYYRLGELFVTASMSETQGLTALEAQMFGLPVVAYAAKGLPFVVGQAGVLIQPEDESAMSEAIVKLLTDPDQMSRVKRQVAKNLQRFDIEQTTAEVVKAYQLAQKISRRKRAGVKDLDLFTQNMR